MRGVILVAFFGYLAVVLRAESEPYFGSGSGEYGTDVVVIAPTNGTKPPTDSTNDSGSGVDDEDDEDYSGSGVSSTTETPTTEQETTTEEATTKTTTETATTSSITTIIPDDQDVYSGSGSGSGFETFTQPQDETTTTSTDIYITETSITDLNTLIIKGRSQVTTTKESITQASTHFKTTPKDVSNVKYTTPSKAPTTESWTTKSAKPTTQSVETTTKAKAPLTRATKQPQPESTEERKFINDLRTSVPTTQSDKTTTPSQSGNIMALQGKKKGTGFTLTTEVIAGVVGCAVLALLLIAFLMYRLKKRDEGSYLLDESNAYPVNYNKIHVSDKEAFI